jgi:hypothetical protein
MHARSVDPGLSSQRVDVAVSWTRGAHLDDGRPEVASFALTFSSIAMWCIRPSSPSMIRPTRSSNSSIRRFPITRPTTLSRGGARSSPRSASVRLIALTMVDPREALGLELCLQLAVGLEAKLERRQALSAQSDTVGDVVLGAMIRSLPRLPRLDRGGEGADAGSAAGDRSGAGGLRWDMRIGRLQTLAKYDLRKRPSRVQTGESFHLPIGRHCIENRCHNIWRQLLDQLLWTVETRLLENIRDFVNRTVLKKTRREPGPQTIQSFDNGSNAVARYLRSNGRGITQLFEFLLRYELVLT